MRAESDPSSSAASSSGSLRLDHPDQARAVAGQGHLCERPGLGVEFGRDEAVAAAVREIEHQRRLRIRTRRGRDARRLARRRQAPVGGDGKRALDAGSVGQTRHYAVRTDCPAIDHCAPPVDARPRRHGRLKRGVQVAIGDVQPEMILGDLRGAEGDDRAADQPLCRIDDPHHLERRGLRRKRGQNAEPIELRECRRHQCRGAPILGQGRRPGQRHLHAEVRKRKGGDQADRTGARNDDLTVQFSVHGAFRHV